MTMTMNRKGVSGVGNFRLYSTREKDSYIAAMVAQHAEDVIADLAGDRLK